MHKTKTVFHNCVVVLVLVLNLVAIPCEIVQARSSKYQFDDWELQIENEYLKLTLFGDSAITLSDQDDRQLLFPGSTTYLTFLADNSVYSPVKNNLIRLGSPTQIDANSAVERFSSAEGLIFSATYTLVGPAIRVEIKTDNPTDQEHTVSARVLLDTQVDENDGSPLWINGSVYTSEKEISGSMDIFKGYDKIPAPDFTSTGVFVTRPDRVAFVHWPSASESVWDYSINPEQPFYTSGYTTTPESDSAVLVYYDFGILSSGESGEAVYYYGLTAPEEQDPSNALLLELQRTRAALESRLYADLDKLVNIQTRTYQAVYDDLDSVNLLKALVNGEEIFAASLSLAVEADPSGMITSGGKLIGDLLLDSMRDQTREAVEGAFPAIYKDLRLEVDDPALSEEIRQTLVDHLDYDELVEDILLSFEELEEKIQEGGLPDSYPRDAVINVLRIYRSQLNLTELQEALLLWTDPDIETMAFQPTGLLNQYEKFSAGLDPVGSLGETMEWTGYAIGAGVATKVIIAIASSGVSLPVEAVIASAGGLAGVAITLGGGQISEGAARAHAFAGVYSVIAAGGEMDLIYQSGLDIISAIGKSLEDPDPWNAEGSVTSISLEDIIIDQGADVGSAQGSVTIAVGNQDAAVAVYATLLGPSRTGRAPIAILGQPSPTRIEATSTQEIKFEYGAPDTKIWREASGYPVDLWVAIGYQPYHVSDNPDLAPGLQVFVGSPEAVDMMRLGDVTVIHAAELQENQSSRREIQISNDAISTMLDLSYLGSDFDLHLYDSQGNHVGQNYDTGRIDLEISDATYSGAGSRPEWILIGGHNDEKFVVEVVAVQADTPEEFVVVAREEPQYPAMLGADSIHMDITPQTTGELSADFAIYEYGYQNGVNTISASLSSFVNEQGETVSLDSASIQIPDSLNPGGNGTGELTISGYPVRPGLYTGQILLTAFDQVTGQPIESTVRLYFRVIDESSIVEAPASSPSVALPGGGNTGLFVILAILVTGGAGAYFITRKNQGKIIQTGAELVLPNGQSYPLHDHYAIGRDSANHLRISEEGVSRNHALIRFAERQWFIQDLESLGGIIVNGSRVNASALKHGDQIRVGNTTIVFREE